jgi:hypothetical protein
MHRPVPLLHVVCCEEVRDAGEPQQQAVLEAEHRGWPDNRGLGEDVADDPLGTALHPSQRLFNTHTMVDRKRGIEDAMVDE